MRTTPDHDHHLPDPDRAIFDAALVLGVLLMLVLAVLLLTTY